MAILIHGTTRQRAERIMAQGPDPNFVEPGGLDETDQFSTYLGSYPGPFPMGTPAKYARDKAVAFPNEGGPVILTVDVPDDIIALAVDEDFLPLSQGLVQFNV